jgi:hypothetical protein
VPDEGHTSATPVRACRTTCPSTRKIRQVAEHDLLARSDLDIGGDIGTDAVDLISPHPDVIGGVLQLMIRQLVEEIRRKEGTSTYLPVNTHSSYRFGSASPKYVLMTKPVKTALHSCALLVTMIFSTITANAGVIDVPNVPVGVNSYRAFQDTTTNLVWLDLDNVFFTDHTYNTVVALLSGSGFHLANLAEIQALQASIPAAPANFSAEAAIVGANYPRAARTRSGLGV